MISIDQSSTSQYPNDFDETPLTQPITEYYFSSPSYDNCSFDPIGEYSSTTHDDPNLFIHNEQLISSRFY
jgi:hypothetical protein